MTPTYDEDTRQSLDRLHHQTDHDFSRGNLKAVRKAFQEAKDHQACLENITYLDFVKYSEDIIDEENDRAFQRQISATAPRYDKVTRETLDRLDKQIYPLLHQGNARAHERGFEEEKDRQACLRYITYDDFLEYCEDMIDEENDREANTTRRKRTAPELWRTLLTHSDEDDPSAENFHRFMICSEFPKEILLGKLWGQHRLRLVPDAGILTEDALQLPDLDKDLELVDHRGLCVKYGEAHPSEEEDRLVTPGSGILRRFWEVGYILMDYGGMMGHVLVVDLDSPDRQPWIILASTWRTEEDDPQTVVVPEYVKKDDWRAHGVLPPNTNRTTVAKLIPATQSGEPLLLQFGPECRLDIEEHGSKGLTATEGGSLLGEVMFWFKRKDGMEVCFDKDRKVYLMRDPSTGEYTYPKERPMEHL
ncbi:MAG: hypothetical protein Q9208_005269 [Pyrenodesmia sp. 3 TL-2023]